MLARVLVAWLRCALAGRGRDATMAILAVAEHADDDADATKGAPRSRVSWSSRAPTRREWAGAIALCVVVAVVMAAAYFRW